MKSHRRESPFISILWLLLAAITWFTLAPSQLGGRLTYVIVDGNSMESHFHRGDLLLVRRQSAYKIGDAVTYRNLEIGRFVFHRIVATELDHFILRGDHNSWSDSYHPVQADIIGKLWLHIPSLGKAIQWVRPPLHLALIVGLLGGILMAGMLIQPSKEKGGQKKPVVRPGNIYEGGLYLTGTLALAFLGLALFAFIRPLTRPVGNLPYQQEGYFFYSATGTQGVYDTDKVRSGEPVFPKLTCFLNIGFTYNLLGQGLSEAGGTHQLYARVIDVQSGWQRTVPLESETAFTGNSYFTLSTLDLCYVESLVSLVEQETGLHPSAYTLEVVSDVVLTARSNSGTMSDTFSPALTFKFDKAHFYLADEVEIDAPLQFSKAGLTVDAGVQANTLPVLGWEPSVLSVRGFSLVGLGIFLGGFLLLAWHLYQTASRDQEALIRFKYRGLIVDVHEQNLEPATAFIEVASIEDLARLAERQNTMILHTGANAGHAYVVQYSGVSYRFVPAARQNIPEPAAANRTQPAQAASRQRSRVTRTDVARQERRGYALKPANKTPSTWEPAREEVLRKIKI